MVYKKLIDPVTPWPEKLDLARHAWYDEGCYFPNKYQLVVEWAFKSYSKKNSLKTDVIGVWKFIDEILTDSSRGNSKKIVALKPFMSTVFIDSINFFLKKNNAETLVRILHLVDLVITNDNWSWLFTTKPEDLVGIMSGVLTLIVAERRFEGEAEFLHTATKIAKQCLIQLPISLGNTNSSKAHELICDQLLTLMIILLNDSSRRFLNEKKFKLELASVIYSVLFNQKHIGLYKCYFYPDDVIAASTDRSLNDRLTSSYDPGSQLFDKLTSLIFNEKVIDQLGVRFGLDPVFIRTTVIGHLPQLYDTFLVRFAKTESLCSFHILTRVFQIVGVSAGKGEKLSPVISCYVLDAACRMLESMSRYDVYNIAADNNQDKPQFRWLQQMFHKLLGHKLARKMPEFHKLLATLMELNHHIVEPHLMAVTEHCLFVELDRPCSQEEMFSTVLTTYSKLRQIPKFLRRLLECVCRLEAVLFLPESFLRVLGGHCQTMPPGAVTEVWTLLCDSAAMYAGLLKVSKTVNTDPQELDEPSPKKQKLMPTSLDDKIVSRLTIVLRMMDSCMSHTSVSELSRLTASCDTLNDTLTRISTRILKQLLSLSSKLKKKFPSGLLSSVLSLVHTWGDVYTLMEDLDKLAPPTLIHTPDLLNPQQIHHNHMPEKRWNHVVKMANRKSNTTPVAESLLQLNLQNLRHQLLKCDSETDRENISSLVETILQPLTGAESSSGPDSWTQSVFYWSTLLRNLPLLLPFCSPDSIMCISSEIVRSLSLDGQNHSTHRDCTLNFVRSSFFQELSPLHESILSEVMKHITVTTPVSKSQTRITQTLKQLCDGFQQTDDKTDSEMTARRLETVVQIWKEFLEFAVLPDVAKLVCYDGQNFGYLRRLVRVASFLPLEYLHRAALVQAMFYFLIFDITLCLSITSQSHDKSQNDTTQAMTLLSSLRELTSVFVIPLRKLTSVWSPVNSDEFVTCVTLCVCVTRDCDAVGELTLSTCKFLSVLLQALPLSTAVSIAENVTEAVVKEGNINNSHLLLVLNSVLRQISKGIHTFEDADITAVLRRVCSNISKLVPMLPPTDELLNINTNTDPTERLNLLQLLTDIHIRAHRRLGGVEEGSDVDVSTQSYLQMYNIIYRYIHLIYSDDTFTLSTLTPSVATGWLRYTKTWLTQPSLNTGSETLKLSQLIWSKLQRYRTHLVSPPGSAENGSILCSAEGTDMMTETDAAMKCLIDHSSDEIVEWILQDLLRNLASCSSAVKVLPTIRTWRIVFSCVKTELKAKQICTQILPIVFFSFENILMRLQSQQTGLIAQIQVAILTCVNDVLNSKLLAQYLQPDMVLFTLHHTGTLTLDLTDPSDLHAIFRANYDILNTLLYHYTSVVYRAIPAYTAALRRLLETVIQHGRQRQSADTDVGGKLKQTDVVQCAHYMTRLYELINKSSKVEFGKVVPYMIAQYLDLLQGTTLLPLVKKALQPGIYNLVDLCETSLNSIDLLKATLAPPVRDVFKSILEDYNHHHKFTGRV